MTFNEPNRFYSSFSRETLKNERDFIQAIKKQIQKEEQIFKAAIKNDAPFEEAKEIRDRIRYLKNFLASEEAIKRNNNGQDNFQ